MISKIISIIALFYGIIIIIFSEGIIRFVSTELIDNILSKVEKKMISLIKTRILEVAINDELYHKYKIFAFQTLSAIVVSPSLIIKSKELNYFFDSFEKILKLGTENIIQNIFLAHKKYFL